jgi:hypothetical protein
MSRLPTTLAGALVAGLLGLAPVQAAPAPAEGAVHARVVTVRGEGASLDQAVRSALRRAVEQAVGVQISATTAVDRFEVVRNEIVSHAEGYVRRYRLIRQGTAENGVAFAEIEAEVDGGRIRDSADAIPALLAMAGHPRVVVLGLDDGFEAVSAVLPESIALRDAAGVILRDRFGFTTLDAKAMARQGSAQRRQDALAAARDAKAEYVVLVSLTGSQRLNGSEVAMEAVKLTDGTVIARDSGSGARAGTSLYGAGPFLAIQDKVFPLTVGMAHQIAADIQQTVSSGNGFRYTLVLTEFPPEDAAWIEGQLPSLPGFVRTQTEARDRRFIQLSVWSQQPTGEFDAALKKILADGNQRTHVRMRGHSFRLDYVDPVFR